MHSLLVFLKQIKDRFSRFGLVTHSLLITLIIFLSLITVLNDGVLRDFSVNIASSLFILIFTILFIDYYFEKKKEEEWAGVRQIVINQIDSLIGKTILSLETFFKNDNIFNLNFNLKTYKSEQSKLYREKIYPTLNVEYESPSIFHYKSLMINMIQIHQDTLLLLSLYLDKIDPKILESLIIFKDFVSMLNQSLNQIDFSNPSNNSELDFKLVNSHVSFVGESLKSISENLILYSGLEKEKLHDLS